eukprot:CAMPEP_0174237652 /NCGR_PEP_ID=MMETSP0417-20130205/8940_1 /TAXON_ID=242541 /ORGANISM="Mayorella sp, Strain BSH-02190019" /LENGTH=156 /DNA_ID=CAMNT_0015316431 /DNA_START=126 /DNA_END=593 /DNA_ORIENTATION=+
MTALKLFANAFVKYMSWIPSPTKENIALRAFGIGLVPVIGYVNPKIEHVDENKCVVRIKHNRRTRNHVGSMYFATLAAGADVCAGFLAMREAFETGQPVIPLFKEFHGTFGRRAYGDVLFTCENGTEVRAAVREALQSGQRVNLPVSVVARVESMD